MIATNTLFITADSLWLCWTADLIPLWWVDRILHNGGNVLILPAPPTHGLPSALLASTSYQLSSLGPRRCPGRESNESKQSWRKLDRFACTRMECKTISKVLSPPVILIAQFSQRSELRSGAGKTRAGRAYQMFEQRPGQVGRSAGFSFYNLTQSHHTVTHANQILGTISLSVKLSFQTKNYFPTRKMNEHSQLRLNHKH